MFGRPILEWLLSLVGAGMLLLSAWLAYQQLENIWPMIFGGVAALLVPQFNRLTNIAIGLTGLKAELSQTIDDARGIIERLKVLAKSQATFALHQLQLGGGTGHYRNRRKHNFEEEIRKSLLELGLSPEEVKGVFDLSVRPYDLFEYAMLVRTAAQPHISDSSHQQWNDFWSSYEVPGQLDQRPTAPSPEKLREVLNSMNANSDEIDNRLQDFEYFHKTSQHRRLDIWLSRFGP